MLKQTGPLSTPPWFSRSIFYQIYPPSFYDSNADGVGDLPGILAKLDYIQALGCNALWLNPCWESPFEDGGYDVTSFYQVDPRYGTNDDLKKLFDECHLRGMRVVLDLVAGHTSNRHPWFLESAKSDKNKYTNWYIWTESVWKGTATPGLEAIRGFSERDGAYITNFFHFQPALNYGFARPDPLKPWQLGIDHPDVQAVHHELRKIMAHWLDAGADGFRVDMASSLVKGEGSPEALVCFWQDIRNWFGKDYPEAVLVAEWSDPKAAITAGFHNDFMIHFGVDCYTHLFRAEPYRDVFESKANGESFFDKKGGGDIRKFLDTYMEHYLATRDRGYISLPSGNHDIGRISMGRTMEELKVIWAFLLTMPGVPYIYYGDEIGMRHIDCPSKEGGYGRTGSRTPMQWDEAENAGFSKASPEELYLPIDPAEDRPTIAFQEKEKDSLLQWVRKLIHLRHRHSALGADGIFVPLYAENSKYPFVYLRQMADEKIVVAVNPSNDLVETEFHLMESEGVGELLFGHGTLWGTKGKFHLQLAGLGAVAYTMK